MPEENQRVQEVLGFVRSVIGGDNGDLQTMPAQASTRRYHRVTTGKTGKTCVVMELPPDEKFTEEDQLPFLNMHRYLERGAYPVPRVYGTRMEAGLIALEDLGDQTLEKAVAKSATVPGMERLYAAAIDLIVDLQERGRSEPDPRCLAFGRQFDFKLLRWELEHFDEWLLRKGRGISPTAAETNTIRETFDALAHDLADSPAVLVHRDFQSRNIMVQENPDENAPPCLRVIDFQDALLGPQVYDIVALLRDSYLELQNSSVTKLLQRYATKTGCEPAALTTLFHKQTVQRKLKDAGRFVFIDKVRGNPGFLPAIPLTLHYVRDALACLPEYRELTAILAKYLPEFRA